MYQHQLISQAFLLVTALCIPVMGFIPTAGGGEDETEILKITVGEPTKLSSKVYQNMSTVMVSRTGVVAVMYRKPGIEPRYPKHTRRGSAMGYRVSTDGGVTWSKEMIAPDAFGGGQNSGTLPDGGVIIPATDPKPSTAHTRAEGWKGEADPNPSATTKTGWYDVRFVRFTDDMMSWQEETVAIYMPDLGPGSLGAPYPGLAKGKMVLLPDGHMLAPMYGGFQGDDKNRHRAFIVQSTDQGHTWKFYASIAYEQVDPHPELPGHYLSSAEPSITLLPNGKMVAMLRTQYSHFPLEYKPMAVCWSDDLGRTWTKPVLTDPHLMNISPTLAALDNGVVACQYGRPGFHIVFSLDDGHTWRDRVSFSHLPAPVITGQFDMIKVGANKLVTVGSDAGGTKIWPITVERVKVSPAHVALTGRVVDAAGRPIAGAVLERGPNRYAADDSLMDSERKKYLGSPTLAFRSIQKHHGYPTTRTNASGQFRFKHVPLGEYVLTVEADGYAPQQRHVQVAPQAMPQDFTLKAGQLVRGRVVNSTGKPLGGLCVALNRWHCHTDPHGYFHWSAEVPVPEQVNLRINKNFSRRYETLETTVTLSRIGRQPITLKHN
jgi:protocatechuate 3,4-dioxygenase beta subunit